jgi:hypothetical protein
MSDKLRHCALSLVVLISTFSFCSAPKAQLPDGSTCPDFTLVDFNGESRNLYNTLAQGKSVLICVFATWSGPDWFYYNQGHLQTFHNNFGPLGTNTAEVWMIEGDANTNNDCLLGLPGCTGLGSQGNWIAGNEMFVMNAPTNAIMSLLEINYFPTIYMVCPDAILTETGQTNATNLANALAACVVIPGCTDPTAINYDPTATIDDGNCVFNYTDTFNLILPDAPICAGSEIIFQFIDFELNPPGGQYQIQFVDTQDTLFLSHADLMASPFFTHTFAHNSCGWQTWNSIDNAFGIRVILYDDAGNFINDQYFDPIYVSGASASYSPNFNPAVEEPPYCLGIDYSFFNFTSTYSSNISGTCTLNYPVTLELSGDIIIESTNEATYPQSITFTPQSAGNVSATATLFAEGCAPLVLTSDLLIDDSAIGLEISVLADGSPFEGMTIELFKESSISTTIPTKSGFSDEFGTYFTDLIPSGSYWVRAKPNPLIAGQEAMLTTYSNEVFQWSQAEQVILGCYGYAEEDINLILLPNQGTHPGIANGNIYYVTDPLGLPLDGVKPAAGSRSFVAGDPIPGLPVILLDTLPASLGGWTPIAITLSDVSGFYQFNNLPNGKYQLYVDAPQIAHYNTHIFNISDAVLSIPGLNFFVDTTSFIYTYDIVGISELPSKKPLLPMPNPANDLLTLPLSSDMAPRGLSAYAFDLAGQRHRLTIETSEGRHITVEVRSLAAGGYTLVVSDGHRMQSARFIKEE